MKINWFLLLIAAAVSALTGYGFWAGTGIRLLTIGAGVSLFVTLCGLLAVSLGRGTANVRALSAVFFVALLVEQLVFAFVPFRTAPYVIVTGLLLLLYATIFYGVTRAR